jgi:hypothetical protein
MASPFIFTQKLPDSKARLEYLVNVMILGGQGQNLSKLKFSPSFKV